MAVQMLTRTRRIVASMAAVLLVMAGLTSCTPEIKGITGLTMDADGQPLAALAWCADRPPDVVLLLAEEDSSSPDPSDVPTPSTNWHWPERRHAVPRDATSPTTVRLVGFPPGDATDPHAAFRLFGIASNKSFASRSVTFRLAELAGLRPGSVLITDIVDNDEVQGSIPLDEFARLGRDAC
ncbi:hypothetical protein ACH4T9_19745 [Micromonospora sp. NPDC020750]|uniref:hypothetical protein n=1 Tax=unclassified Micromonospora TaxID=2617518 RepID=UPI0037B90248